MVLLFRLRPLYPLYLLYLSDQEFLEDPLRPLRPLRRLCLEDPLHQFGLFDQFDRLCLFDLFGQFDRLCRFDRLSPLSPWGLCCLYYQFLRLCLGIQWRLLSR